MYYLFIFLLLLVLSVIHVFGRWNRYSDLFIYGMLFIIFWFTAGLRYETGIDWLTYTENFERTNPINIVFSSGFGKGMYLEPSYGLICSCVKYFGGSIQSVFFIMAFISTCFLFKSISLYSYNKAFSLLIYFCFVYLLLDMTGMRQAVAFNIFFYSTQFIRDQKMVKYLLFILLALTFHLSSIILFPLYFIVNKNITNRIMYVSVGIGLLLFLFHIGLLGLIVKGLLLIFENTVVSEKIILYTKNLALATSRPFSLEMIIYLIFFILLLSFRKHHSQNDNTVNICYNFIWLHLLSCFYLYEYYDLSVRIAIFFIIGYVILLPEILCYLQVMTNKVIVTLIICSLCFLPKRAIFLEQKDGLPYNPYQNYWYYTLFEKESSGKKRLEQYKPKR